MIDIDIEEKFINQFIKKDFRQRLGYELWGKKRRHGLSRFCHNAKELLIESKIIADDKNIGKKEIQGLLPPNCKNSRCYIMAYNESIDGTVCDLEEALKKVLGNGMAAVIIFDGFAVVETEQCFGSAEKMVLCSSN